GGTTPPRRSCHTSTATITTVATPAITGVWLRIATSPMAYNTQNVTSHTVSRQIQRRYGTSPTRVPGHSRYHACNAGPPSTSANKEPTSDVHGLRDATRRVNHAITPSAITSPTVRDASSTCWATALCPSHDNSNCSPAPTCVGGDNVIAPPGTLIAWIQPKPIPVAVEATTKLATTTTRAPTQCHTCRRVRQARTGPSGSTAGRNDNTVIATTAIAAGCFTPAASPTTTAAQYRWRRQARCSPSASSP